MWLRDLVTLAGEEFGAQFNELREVVLLTCFGPLLTVLVIRLKRQLLLRYTDLGIHQSPDAVADDDDEEGGDDDDGEARSTLRLTHSATGEGRGGEGGGGATTTMSTRQAPFDGVGFDGASHPLRASAAAPPPPPPPRLLFAPVVASRFDPRAWHEEHRALRSRRGPAGTMSGATMLRAPPDDDAHATGRKSVLRHSMPAAPSRELRSARSFTEEPTL